MISTTEILCVWFLSLGTLLGVALGAPIGWIMATRQEEGDEH
jgi:hypothetical protein